MSGPDWDAIKERSRKNQAKRLAKRRAEEEVKRQRHSPDRAAQWLRAARVFKRQHGRWPYPAELRDSGLM